MTKVTTEYFGEINFFPCQPQAPMSELLEWNSSVTNSIDGTEDRDSNVEEPSQTLEMTFPLDSEKKREAFNSLYGAIREKWYLPLWSESQYVGDITDNQDTIDCNTLLYNFNMQTIDGAGLYNTPVLESVSSEEFDGLRVCANSDFIFVSDNYTLSVFDFTNTLLYTYSNVNFWSMYCVGDFLYGPKKKYLINSNGSLTLVYNSTTSVGDNAITLHGSIIYYDWGYTAPDIYIREVNESDGSISDSYSLSGLTHGVRGLAVDGTYIYVADCSQNECTMYVRKYDISTKSLLTSSAGISVKQGRQSLQMVDGNLILLCGDILFGAETGLIIVMDTEDMSTIESHFCKNYSAWIQGDNILASGSSVTDPALYIYEFDSAPSDAGLAVIYNGQSHQLIEYTGKTSGSISVTGADAMSDAYIAPVKSGFIAGDAGNNTNGFSSTLNIRFMLDDNLEFSESTPAQYLGDDVYYDIVPEKTADVVQKKIIKDQLLSNFKLGPVDVSSYWTNSRVGFPFKKTLYSHSDVYDFRDFLYRRAGRYRQFWSPSFEFDIRCISDGLIQSEMLVKSDSIIDYVQERDHIVVVDTDGNHYPRAITSFLQVDSDRVELTLSSSLGLYDYEISSVSFMGIYRLNSDKVKIKWNTNNIAIATAGLVEIEP